MGHIMYEISSHDILIIKLDSLTCECVMITTYCFNSNYCYGGWSVNWSLVILQMK